MKSEKLILGAGITGLSAGVASGAEIFEGTDIPGGICASYYMGTDGVKSFHRENDETYRFEIGGGRWIFGADSEVLGFINSLSPVKNYERKSSVYFPDLDVHVPYPIQNHLYHFPKDVRTKALNEILNREKSETVTLSDWLEVNFGKTLCKIFFFPFHELYTAGLYTKISPQDSFKTPMDKDLIIKGSQAITPSVGYNAKFVYPINGLDDLIQKMAAKCRINYNKRAIKINPKSREVLLGDGAVLKYENLISTLPLNKMADMAGIDNNESDPFTSVLVINIGARIGEKCPSDQWIYVPKSRAGFHRVGFYSNVDASFLPLFSRNDGNRVSIYAEKAYAGGMKPSGAKIKKVCEDTVSELKQWQFISEAEAVDPTWIEMAYTWQRPGSLWKDDVIARLKAHDINQAGRYGKWKFQGIAESIKDGFGQY